MWWLLLLVWWCGTSAIDPGPDSWTCPEINEQPIVECTCDMPHALRCTGDKTALKIIGENLRSYSSPAVSLLDCTIQNVTVISDPILNGISLHGLVISSGELKDIHSNAFQALASPLQALGLPNNQLISVPTQALMTQPELDRLDLSGNKMRSLDTLSFKGLKNLTFIDLSENIISKIAPGAFDNLPRLKNLRLRGNRITLPVVSKLNAIPSVEELDISGNALVGPLSSKTFPKMNFLADLQLTHNSLSSIKMGTLQGLINLSSLNLHHNQIDVIEDHAFIYLTSLVSLNLSHNRIVAVSGASLAHLTKLTDLDLRQNFLRALTPDLVIPLKSLKNLKLDENDISIVASDALKASTVLKHLTLSENPLNCDCSLTEFASWLANSSLSKSDKSTAVCTTPPSLENGLLIDVPLENLLCGVDEEDSIPMSSPYKAIISLKNFRFDGKTVELLWAVENEVLPYTCNAIYVYEEEGLNEVLIESHPLICNSSNSPNPKFLNITVPDSIHLQRQHRYRYCVVLFESGQSDDVSLLLGCSDVLPLVENVKVSQKNNFTLRLPKIVAIQANLSALGSLSIEVVIYPQTQSKCEINVAVLEQTSIISQRRMNCSDPKYTFIDLNRGPYRICANVVHPGPVIDLNKPRCVTVFKKEHKGFTTLDVAFVSVFIVLCFTVIALIWGVRKILLKPKLQTHQCFLPPDREEAQHNRYIKLEATTNL